MEGGGGGVSGHPDPEIRGGPISIFFRPLGPQFGVKVRGGGPPGPSPGSATANKRNGQNCSSSQALMGAESPFASLREEKKRTLRAGLNPVKPLKSPMPKILD